MRRDKLVEVMKQIAREKLDERNHLPSLRYAAERATRQKKGLKLAQEEENVTVKADTGGVSIFTLNPVITSSQQSR